MNVQESQTGTVKIMGPDEGDSFWQPVPANGFVRNIFSRQGLGAQNDFSIGTQTVAPGCFIREHTHAHNEEIIFVVEGKGVARIDGVEHPIEKGSAVYIGVNRKHHFLNPNSEPMTFLWIMMPGGLDRFFAEIGRPRTPGEPAPEPFPRPENVAEIEARTVFGWVDASFNQRK
jgi:mannose-6-phosphate isomerase-like protein (cupin superfamily)